MEIRMAKEGSPLVGVAEVVTEMQRQLPTQQAEWLQQLRDKPETFADLERKVHGVFQQLADQMVAGLLAETTKPAEWAHEPKKSSRSVSDEAPLGRTSAVDVATFGWPDSVGKYDLLWTGGSWRQRPRS